MNLNKTKNLNRTETENNKGKRKSREIRKANNSFSTSRLFEQIKLPFLLSHFPICISPSLCTVNMHLTRNAVLWSLSLVRFGQPLRWGYTVPPSNSWDNIALNWICFSAPGKEEQVDERSHFSLSWPLLCCTLCFSICRHPLQAADHGVVYTLLCWIFLKQWPSRHTVKLPGDAKLSWPSTSEKDPTLQPGVCWSSSVSCHSRLAGCCF